MKNVDDRLEALRPFFGGSLSAFYLYGSAAMDDFRPGWSDIDILVLLDGAPAVQRYADTLEKEWVKT